MGEKARKSSGAPGCRCILVETAAGSNESARMVLTLYYGIGLYETTIVNGDNRMGRKCFDSDSVIGKKWLRK